jgi:MoaA/NifB/PqqE/SkfB family radical SAM enzyme
MWCGEGGILGVLKKIYIEPTNRCNLSCVTCIRHAWEEPMGDMAWPAFQSLIDGLADFPGEKTIAFAGLGEPLLHEQFPEMVRLAHERGLRTEMTSNAMLLTSSLAARLIDAGLNQFTVSIDGVSDEAHGAIRTGASLEGILDNVRELYYRHSKKVTETKLRIGIEFVAMRSNIRELPKLRGIAERIKASFILVTNLLPYTAELRDEILYNMVPTTLESSKGEPYVPLWILPYMDWSRETQEPLSKVMYQRPNLSFLDINLNERNNYCPFVQAGSAAVAWHGGVSPCPPLLHSYRCFIRGRQKEVRRCEYGRLPEQSLKAIWLQPEYVAFRERVREFQFSPCTDCGGCDWAEKNEEDCFGNPFPVCGDCLWARGVLRCA